MFKLKKFIGTVLLCAGVLAQFGAKENNPTECDKYGHLWVSSPQPLSCVGSVKCPNPTVTISQYTEYTPFFISTLRPGRINTTKRCSRCGAKGDASETRHDVSSVMEGANPGSPVNSNTPGTYLVTLTQYCTQCGEVAKGSCRITVVAGGVPPTTPPGPPMWPPSSDPDGEGEPPAGDSPQYVRGGQAANTQPIYVDIYGLPQEMKRPQAEEEKDQPDSFFRIDMGTLLPSMSTADISIPVGNGDLKLELRRNFNMQGTNSSISFGHSWSSNLQGAAQYPGEKLRVASNDDNGTTVLADVVTVWDEDGGKYNYVYAKHYNEIPNYETAFSSVKHADSARYKVFTPWVTNGGESDSTKTFVYLDTQTKELFWCRKFGTRFQFQEREPENPHFRLLRITDRNGNSIRYDYSAATGHLEKMLYEQDESIYLAFQFNSRGMISEVSDALGNTWKYSYSILTGGSDKILLDHVSAPPATAGGERAVTTYAYEAMKVLGNDQYFDEGEEIDSENPSYVHVPNDKDRIWDAITSVTYPNGLKIEFQYATFINKQVKQLAKVITPDGEVKFTNLESCNVADPGSVDVNNPGKTKYRDMVWNSVIDINGHRWDYQFTKRRTNGRMLTSDGNLSGVVLGQSYSQVNRMFSKSPKGDAQPEIVQWNYEICSPEFASNLVKVTDNNGYVTRYSYPLPTYSAGSIFGGIGSGGAIIESGYNYFAAGNVKQEIYHANGKEFIKEFDYDPNTNVMTKVISPRGVVSIYEMDSKGNRLKETTTWNGQTRILTFEYDQYGIQKKSVDGDGRITLTDRAYSDTGWTDTTTIKGLNGAPDIVSSKEYDVRGCMVKETDANGNVTDYEYNALGQVVKIIYPEVNGSRPSEIFERDISGQVVKKTDRNGNVTRYTYDKMYRITEVRTVMPAGGDIVTSYTYDKAGNKATVTDPEGMVTTYTYDGYRRVLTESKPNPVGDSPLVTSYEYGENSGSNLFTDEGFKPTKIIDPKGIVTEMTYDEKFRLLTTVRAGIRQETNEYDAEGNVTKKTVHNSTGDQITEMTYDAFNNLLTSTQRMGGNASDDLVTTTEYSAGGLPVKVTDPAGTVTETAYDGAGRKIRETVKIPGGTDIVTEYAYDANGNVTATTLKNSIGSGDQVTQTAYDALNRPVSVTDPEGNTVLTSYDANGNKIKETDPAGNVTDYEYDAANRLVKTVYPEVYDGEAGVNRRPELLMTYDRRGLVTSTTDVRGTLTENEYDVLGRKIKSTVFLEGSEKYIIENKYDVLNNLIEETTWRGSDALIIATEYDSFNRPIKVTDQAGYSESYTYDTVGNKLSIIDKRGNTTNFTFDLANRQIKMEMPEVAGNRPTTITDYDKAGRIISVTDPNQKVSRTEYDAAGRKVKSINAAGREIIYTYDSVGCVLTQTVADQTTAYTYDKRQLQLTETLNPGDSEYERITTNVYDNRGNRIRRIQANGAITNYSYDAQGRLLSATQEGAPEENRFYTYNAAGIITFVEEGEHATGYLLDKLGRVVEERTFTKEPLGTNWIPKSVIKSTYDVVGNRLTVTYPNNRTLTSSYDLRNLLASVSDGVKTTVYGYDAVGNRTSMVMPNGVMVKYVFDSNNRLTNIKHTDESGNNLYSAEYTLDPAGMRIAIAEIGINRDNRILNFSYDDIYQLIRETDSSRNNGSPISYTYDVMGNRTQKVDNGITTIYTVDKLNRILSATTGDHVIAYTYDANGNTASKTVDGVTRFFHFDRENRLVRVTEGDDNIFSAIYDYRNRRLEKTENGDTISYLYDGGVSVQEYDADGSLKNYLVRAGGYGGGIGDVICAENADGSNREYFLYNATGTTSALTDDSGKVTSTSCYTAWGVETATVGETNNVRKFSTKERSIVLGIDYFGFRYYDPELGRFISRDMTGYPDGPNNYLYCKNSPVNYIDALGLKSSLWQDIKTTFSSWKNVKEVSRGFGEGAVDGLVQVTVAEDRSIVTDIAMSVTPAGFVNDFADIGHGIKNIANGDYKKGGILLAGGIVGIVPVAGDAAKIGIKAAGKEILQEAGEKVAINVVTESTQIAAKNLATESTKKAINQGVQEASDVVEKVLTQVEKNVKSENTSGFRGGAYRDMKYPAGDGKDAHHMPADAINGIPREKGSAIQMDPVDHKQTSSYGRDSDSTQFRKEQKQLIESGNMRGAMAREIWDVRRVAREGGDVRKYNKAMQKMLEYAKKEKMLNKKNKE